ncbi:MAG TPA: glycine zipper 2TM domain-containing protein [Polaromonas sp.]|uniref:glycine zipper 2TM domain-containing protein n=1 Tax=Polaromonas sp. TaxID=1869339 RepID=UPI002D669835|nr:glycine zipper 2TM domain-containing protein [Polaromonas sp.]HYW57000.1 glycine zipper 2TM domain-containing protein [Polaromonas sp.]
MNTSIDNPQPGLQAASPSSKPLWAAVGILGVAVLAMGATMIYQQRTPAPTTTLGATTQSTMPKVAAYTQGNAADDLVEKPAAAAPKPAPAPAKKIAKPVPKPASAPSYARASTAPAPYYPPAPAPVVQVCATCGSVESVTPIERSTKPSGVGVGTVAGGVLGAVLGNQVGHGNGRAVATVIGAVGGGFAGNAIEKHVRKETVYQVGVRMEDGSRRVVEVPQAPAVGSRVTVDGSGIRANDGVTYRAPAPLAQPVHQQQTGYNDR